MQTAPSSPAGRVRNQKSSVAKIALGIAAGTMVIRIPGLSEPRWYFDESVFTTVAWAMSKGLPLYAGVYDLQPPGIYWLYRLMLGLGAGEHHFVVQIVAALFVIATALLTYAIAGRFMALWPAALAGSLTGLVLSIPTLDGDLLNVELVGLPFFLTSLLLAFNRRSPVVFASGVLLGVALVNRPSFALDALALLVPLLGMGRREMRLALAALGVAATLAAATILLWMQGSLDAYITIVVPSDHLYLLRANGGTLGPLFVRLAVLGVIVVAGLHMARSPRGRLIAVWLPASLAGASLTPLEYTHFAHEAIPALAFAIALIACRFRRRWLAAPAAAVALVVCAEAVLILPPWQTALMLSTSPPRPFLHNFGFETLPAYYANWVDYAAAQKSESQYAAWFAEAQRQHDEVALLRGLADSSNARLQVLGARPWIYFESGLLPATRYVTTVTPLLIVPSAAGDLQRSLINGCPDLVVAVSASQLDYWRDDLDRGRYIEVRGAPWPTFRSIQPHHACT
jgi:hypothetical protein